MAYKSLVAGCASVGEFIARLIAGVSPDEWNQLEAGGFEGEINAFNRATLLRLREWDTGDGQRGSFDADGAERMADLLEDFLNQHLSDNPAARRWITLSCLALAFVFREPLHPIEVVGAKVNVVDGKVAYYCPAREGDETLCGYCACRPMSELPEIEGRAAAHASRVHGEESADTQDSLASMGTAGACAPSAHTQALPRRSSTAGASVHSAGTQAPAPLPGAAEASAPSASTRVLPSRSGASGANASSSAIS